MCNGTCSGRHIDVHTRNPYSLQSLLTSSRHRFFTTEATVMSVCTLPQWMIEHLDLRNYGSKLLDPHGKFRWSAERVEHALLHYRSFLLSAATCTKGALVHPTPDVDEVWHLHILDTQSYADDCNRLFGKFIHHMPTYTTMEGALCSSCGGSEGTEIPTNEVAHNLCSSCGGSEGIVQAQVHLGACLLEQYPLR